MIPLRECLRPKAPELIQMVSLCAQFGQLSCRPFVRRHSDGWRSSPRLKETQSKVGFPVFFSYHFFFPFFVSSAPLSLNVDQDSFSIKNNIAHKFYRLRHLNLKTRPSSPQCTTAPSTWIAVGFNLFLAPWVKVVRVTDLPPCCGSLPMNSKPIIQKRKKSP